MKPQRTLRERYWSLAFSNLSISNLYTAGAD
jgi:hypothetical protein